MKKAIFVVIVLLAAIFGIALHEANKNVAPMPAQPVTTQQQPEKPKPTEPHSDAPDQPYELQFLALTNHDRQVNNLPTLTYDNRLETSAANKCNDMLTRHYFAHDGGQGQFYFFPPNAASDGENLEQGSYSPQVIEQAWMNSPEHRANILGHYDSIGFAQCGDFTVAHFILWKAIDKGEL